MRVVVREHEELIQRRLTQAEEEDNDENIFMTV